MKNSSTLHWLSSVTGKRRLYIFFLLLIQGLLGASSVGYAVILRHAIDKAVDKDGQGFVFWLVMSILLVTTQITLRAVYRWLEELSRATIENSFKKRLFKHLLNGDYAQISATHSGEWMNRLTSDTVVVADGLVQIVPNLVGMGVKMLGALALILFYLPKFGSLMIVGGLLIAGCTLVFRKQLKKLHRKIQEADGSFRSFTQENLASLMIVKAFVKEREIANLSADKMEQHKHARMRKNHFSNLCNIGFAVAMNGVYLIGFTVSGYGIINGTLSYGTLMAVLQLITQVQSPFANITGYLPKYYAMLVSAERLIEVEKTYADDTEILPLKSASEAYDKLKSIAINSLTFSYHNAEEKVLDGFSLDIHKGDYIALTGLSGCGKSTLLKLLMCIYHPDNGEIRLNLNDTTDTLDTKYRRLFAYVPQGNFLMSGTIKEIITFYADTGDNSAVWDALHIACADEFVKELADGLNTVLGERGVGISEGQMQRIAIARVIYSGNPILLLDEATSALDEQTEAKLLENLKSLTDKTVLIITHRQKALEICNRMIKIGESDAE